MRGKACERVYKKLMQNCNSSYCAAYASVLLFHCRSIDENGLVVIYDFGITDRMVENDDYTRWYQDEYLSRFPKPPRKENKWTQADLADGFVMEKQTEYEMEYSFTLDKFCGVYADPVQC